MRAAATGRPTAAMVARAAEWAALLDDESAGAEQRAACEAWCEEHPLHRLALRRMRGLDQGFARLDPVARTAVRLAADRPRGRRPAAAAAALGGLCLAVGLGWALSGVPQLRALVPDHRTAVGEVRSVALADGSSLALDTGSAVDVALDGATREVTLFRGQVLARVARDPARPFTVRTADGTATALGTAYAVRLDGGGTVVTVVSSRVRVCPAGAAAARCLELSAGERARLARGTATRLPATDAAVATAWATGWLVADDQPLAAVLAELDRYRARPLRRDPAALAGLRVTGSFPLADTDRALEALAATLGLRLGRDAAGRVVSVAPR